MTTAEALKNYYRDFVYLLKNCEEDEKEINANTLGTPYFHSIDEAWAYLRELSELLDREGIPK